MHGKSKNGCTLNGEKYICDKCPFPDCIAPIEDDGRVSVRARRFMAKALLEQGINPAEIAKRLQVSIWTIYRIRRGA